LKKVIAFVKGNLVFLILLAAILYGNQRFDRYLIRTGSMEPELQTGAIVAADSRRAPEKGEIGVYFSNGNAVIHRVIDITEDGYWFQGDANPEPDTVCILKKDVKGTVVFRLNAAAPILREVFRLFEIG